MKDFIFLDDFIFIQISFCRNQKLMTLLHLFHYLIKINEEIYFDIQVQGGEKSKSDKKWTLTPEDVDEIMQGIISKPNMFWLPTIFSERKETKGGMKINKEAKE